MSEDQMMLIGVAFLAIANLSCWFLHPAAGFGQGSIDGTIGVLFGVSIGCLLLSMWLPGRRSSGEGRTMETSADAAHPQEGPRDAGRTGNGRADAQSSLLVLTGLLTVVLGCSDRSPTSPEKAASAASSETVEAPIVRADRRSRTPRVIPPREDKRLPPGVWGSDQASMTIKDGSATLKIFALALPPNGCFGSYGDISREIPNGLFSLAGTYTQLTGAYPGTREYPAQFSGFVEGTRMTITITVPALTLVLGPFVLTYGVTNAWGPCLYP